MLNSIQDAVKLILPYKRKTNATSGWISFNSVCCEHNGETKDTRGRGGIINNSDGAVSYSCFNCNFKASYVPGRHLTYRFRKLLSWLGADEGTIKRLVIDAIRIRELVAPEVIVEAEEADPIKFKARSLPEEALTFHELNTFYELNDNVSVPSDWHNAVVYSAGRNVDLNKYQLLWTSETQYNLNKRVIIPFTWRNEIIGYTARAFDDTTKPKYHSSYEPNYVFNVDTQQADWRFVIVSEGPFDAMAIDGVAVLSNECSEIQADIIDSLAREVIVVPDADKAGAKLIAQAVEYGWSVSFPDWLRTHKDISAAVAEFGKLFVMKTIIESKQSNKLKIELHKRKLYN